jgi:hypothetical protein
VLAILWLPIRHLKKAAQPLPYKIAPIFKKIRNKLKFVGANKAVLETGLTLTE